MKTLRAFFRRSPDAAAPFVSGQYWEERYQGGGNSGPGSYGRLARFKADVLNAFVREQQVGSVVEFGCGDGNQLALAEYRRYTGYDVSAAAVQICRERFRMEPSKEFFLSKDYDGRQADLALSLDVIFHLIEDDVYEGYMRRLFASARRHVAVYSSNMEQERSPGASHVRHRAFTAFVDRELAGSWRLVRTVPNAYPYDGADYQTRSFSDFYFYEKR
jgi:protein O-GlcNAc transferase